MIIAATIGLAATPLIAMAARSFRRTKPGLTPTGWCVLAAGCGLAGLAVSTLRPVAAAVAYAISLAAILTAAAIDAAEQRLPNLLTVGAGAFALVALPATSIATGISSPWRAVAGGAIFGGWILLGALVVSSGYGLGDVKLAAVCGILLGWISWHTLAIGILAVQVAITVVLLHARSCGRSRAPLGFSFAIGTAAAIAVGIGA